MGDLMDNVILDDRRHSLERLQERFSEMGQIKVNLHF
jgi:hypothetical protein